MKVRQTSWIAALLALLACVPAPQATARRQTDGSGPAVKYKKLLYPQGMPMCEDPDDPNGKKVEATFRLYGETALPFAGQAAVLYSQDCEVNPGMGSDFEHALYLAIVQATGPQLRVIRVHDLTEAIPIQLEVPGEVAVLDALLETFVVSKEITPLHVHIWARLSGSGNLSQASDLFYRPEKDGSLNLLLELKDTGGFGRSGACDWNAGSSNIWLADKDGDSVMEIYVETQEREFKECRPSSREHLTVYRFVKGKYERDATQPTKIPGGLAPSSLLKRSPRIIFPDFEQRP